MRNDAKPLIPPRAEETPGGGAAARDRAAPSAATGGRLRDRTLEQSARRSGGTEAAAFDLDTSRRNINVSLLISALAILAVILLVIVFINWPSEPITPQLPDEQPAAQP